MRDFGKAIKYFRNKSSMTQTELAEKLSVKSGALLWCVRIAVSGMPVTPGGATEIMDVLGKEESLRRIETAIEKLTGKAL